MITGVSSSTNYNEVPSFNLKLKKIDVNPVPPSLSVPMVPLGPIETELNDQ
jgi:hypothetical protein